MLCHIKAREGLKVGWIHLMRASEVRERNRGTTKCTEMDGTRRGRTGKLRDQSKQENRHTGRVLQNMRKQKKNHPWNINDRWCNGKMKGYFSPPHLPPSSSNTSLLPPSPSEAVCWNPTAQIKQLHRLKLAAAAKARSHADSAVPYRGHCTVHQRGGLVEKETERGGGGLILWGTSEL